MTFATPDPDPVPHSERVKASTRWCGPSGAEAINKRTGWAVGLWRYANDIEPDADRPPSGPIVPPTPAPVEQPPPRYWFQCVDINTAGNPVFERRDFYGIDDRPDLTYIEEQPIAHGILRNVGRLVDITIRTIRPDATEHTYTWHDPTHPDLELNAAGEWILLRDGVPHARACPVTRAIWIDEGHPAGTTVWADYTVVPPPDPADIVDATDEIQRILNGNLSQGIPPKSVVLPRFYQGQLATFYVRPHREADPTRGITASTGVTIPQGPGYPLGIRGQDERLITKKGFAYERRSVLRLMPGELGVMIKRGKEVRPQDPTPQEGGFLRHLTLHGALDSFDLLSLTGIPPQSHHGAELGAIADLECTGVRFFACFDDGLKLDRETLQWPSDGTLEVLSGGQRFRVLFESSDAPFTPTGIREGQTKLDNDPLQEVRFKISLPGGIAFGGWPGGLPQDEPLDLYAANATEPKGGLAPIGFLTHPPANLEKPCQPGDDPYYAGPNCTIEPNYTTDPNNPTDPDDIDDWRPLSTYTYKVNGSLRTGLAYAKAIGWLNPLTGEGCMNGTEDDGYWLPDDVDIPVTFEAIAIASNRHVRITECEFEQNGRNGLTFASCEGFDDDRAEVHGLAVRANARLDAAIGLEGSFASDLQLGTTARFSAEHWQEIAASGIEVTGARTRAMKIGQEQGHRYMLGPGSYYDLTIRDSDDRALGTSGFDCGPLTFEEVRIQNCARGGIAIGHAGGTDATTIYFDNPKVGYTGALPNYEKDEPNFDEAASVPDLSVSNDAYHPAQYYRDPQAPTAHVFRDLRGPAEPTGPHRPQMYVQIQAFGVIVDGASHTHFVVRPSGSAPDPAWDCYDRDDYPAGDPPVELRNIDEATCTFDLAPGTILNGVVQ